MERSKKFRRRGREVCGGIWAAVLEKADTNRGKKKRERAPKASSREGIVEKTFLSGANYKMVLARAEKGGGGIGGGKIGKALRSECGLDRMWREKNRHAGNV